MTVCSLFQSLPSAKPKAFSFKDAGADADESPSFSSSSNSPGHACRCSGGQSLQQAAKTRAAAASAAPGEGGRHWKEVGKQQAEQWEGSQIHA